MTISPDQWTIFIILGCTLILFGWGKWRYDLVALAAMSAVILTGLIHPNQAFAGFGHPAVITVAAVLIISQALKNAGVVDMVASHIMPLTRHPLAHIFVLTAVVTFFSAFMNNVGALALMLPVALATAHEHQRPPAMLLMPIAFGSILGGMTTMIGTPPNIIIATYRAELTGESFGFFDFSPVGLSVAIAGVFFITLIGWRLIPAQRMKQNTTQQLFEVSHYLTEVKVLEGSPLVGQTLQEIELFDNDDIGVVGVTRGYQQTLNTSLTHTVRDGDILILRGDPSALQSLLSESGLEFSPSSEKAMEQLSDGKVVLVECIITPSSPLVGRDSNYLRRRTANGVALIGVAKQGSMVSKRLRQHVFRSGDILLLQCTKEYVGEMIASLSLLPLAERGLKIEPPKRVLLAMSIFIGAITLGVMNVLPMAAAFVLALVAFSVLGFLGGGDIYREVDWPIIVLLGAMIPVGQALQTTGATELLANSIVGLTEGLSLHLILALVLITTMFLSDIINNAATALVMAPISVNMASQLGVNVDPFLMAVAVGASCAFLTPIGHQSNTLVMSPGGYQFGDYWRMGLPLEVLITLMAVPLIPMVWPF